ncbi:hypothetical protein EJ03DRAFT_171631 [Teratosphaeria nubilosa]|uniref:RNI-like protein n=1 Tax=Teratosphaeria nubilosa TaxID=161662 RepID=A0A6G1LJV0_9PEZI|nr:hypothetical protein EJ03DRAFT_171631 [Teratosphaeria nubilosa]
MASSGMEALPHDLWHLVAAELAASARASADQEAARPYFAALYNGILSGKFLANAFITALYRICFINQSPVGAGGSESITFAEQDIMVMKWSILWRAIIMSALGKTLYPYARHLRVLDLRDLSLLIERLDEGKFKGKVAKQFFAGDLKRFHHVATTGKWRIGRLESKQILMEIGDTMTNSASLIEGISEPSTIDIMSSKLATWIPRLQHLRELELGDAKALGNEIHRNLFHAHCPQLSIIRIFQSTDHEADHSLGLFISGMPPNTLTHFENLSTTHIGPETCLALNSHGKSLASLKVALEEEGILALALLQDCTNLETLHVSALRPSVDLKATQNDTFLEMLDWLGRCNELRDVSFTNVLSAPDLLLPVLQNDNVKLKSLQVDAKEGSLYVVNDHHDFHRSLAKQTALESLHLRADPDPISRDDLEILIESLERLTNIRELNLYRISDYFSDQHIIRLARCMRLLRILYVGGYGITDAVLPDLAGLKYLKSLTLAGITTFTVEGLLDFVARLESGNRDLQMSVDMADPQSMIPDESQDLIREAIVSKVNGRFEYQLLRDPNMPEFSDSDSD